MTKKELKFELCCTHKIVIENLGTEFVGEFDNMDWKVLESFAQFIQSIVVAHGCSVIREQFCFHRVQKSHLEFGVGFNLLNDSESADIVEVVCNVSKFVVSEPNKVFDLFSLEKIKPSLNDSEKQIVNQFVEQKNGRKIKYGLSCKIGDLNFKLNGAFLKPIRKLQPSVLTTTMQGVVVGVHKPSSTLIMENKFEEITISAKYDTNFQHFGVSGALQDEKVREFKINQRENEKGKVVFELQSLNLLE